MADELLAVARDRARTNRFWQHLGIDVAEVREGWARLRVDVRDELRNAPGAPVHGGVYAALVDAAIGCALATVNPESGGGVGQTTLDLNVSYLAAARGATIFLITSDLDEAFALGDAIQVIYRGRLSEKLTPEEAAERAPRLMAGL